MRRVGILTSGGDCQGLNTAIRGVCKALYENFGKNNLEIYGFIDGYKGLIKGKYKILLPNDFSGILNVGGTILGTSRQPFKKIRVIEEDKIDKVKAMKDCYAKLDLDCIVVLGGNGTQKTANLLSLEGLNVVSLPKTIDNDIWGTDMTFGFQSAVDIATHFVDCIHTTASSHGRVFIVELMGHKVGWLTLHAGLSGGADVILIPEIPYDINSIARTIENRRKNGKKFSIIAVAEGAKDLYSDEQNKKSSHNQMVSYKIANKLGKLINQEIKMSAPGHCQRGGSPCPYDRFLATKFGASAAELIIRKDYGKMVAMKNNNIVSVSLNDIAGKLKIVPKNDETIRNAKSIGISFGD